MQELCKFIVNTFILLYFLRFQEGGATALLYSPPKSATGFHLFKTFSAKAYGNLHGVS